MRDPYNLLGVDRNATDDEIKKAYRELCRKYHPDKNPGNKSAEEMFKIVQEAYDQIMNERKMNSGSTGYGSYGSYGSSGSYNAGNSYDPDATSYQAAANYISSGHYNEAVNVLMGIRSRSAQWYYLSALANNGLGNNSAAQEQARTAVSMEPGNMMYQQLLRNLQMGGMNYQNTQYMNYGGGSSDAGSFCMQLCMINLCLNMCCDSSCCC